jgi:hypothetical protein
LIFEFLINYRTLCLLSLKKTSVFSAGGLVVGYFNYARPPGCFNYDKPKGPEKLQFFREIKKKYAQIFFRLSRANLLETR